MTTIEHPPAVPSWATTTVRIPMSPFIHFDRYRRKILEAFGSLERRIQDDFTAEFAKFDAYLATLHGSVAPVQPHKQRWLHRASRLVRAEGQR